jgi:hypothetical protein
MAVRQQHSEGLTVSGREAVDLELLELLLIRSRTLCRLRIAAWVQRYSHTRINERS